MARGNRWLWRLKETAPLVFDADTGYKAGGKRQIGGFCRHHSKVLPLPDEYKTIRQYGPFPALYQAGDKTGS